MFKQMLAGVNRKRWSIAMVVGALYVWLTDFLIHGMYLKERYMETAAIWRPEADMRQYIVHMFFGQFLLGAMLATLFARGYQGKGIREGLRFGVLIGLFALAPLFVTYAVMPLPADIFWTWVVAGFIQTVLGGVVVAKAYSKK